MYWLVIRFPIYKINAFKTKCENYTVCSFPDIFKPFLKEEIQECVDMYEREIKEILNQIKRQKPKSFKRPPSFLFGYIIKNKKKLVDEKGGALVKFYVDWETWEVSFKKPPELIEYFELFVY